MISSRSCRLTRDPSIPVMSNRNGDLPWNLSCHLILSVLSHANPATTKWPICEEVLTNESINCWWEQWIYSKQSQYSVSSTYREISLRGDLIDLHVATYELRVWGDIGMRQDFMPRVERKIKAASQISELQTQWRLSWDESFNNHEHASTIEHVRRKPVTCI